MSSAGDSLALPPPLSRLLLRLLLLLLAVATAASADDAASAASSADAAGPLERLASVFGVRRVPGHLRASAAPLFLSRLYESLSDSNGLSLRPVPYSADSVVAYGDKALGTHSFYAYNVTRAPYQGTVRFADLHLFRLRPRAGAKRRRRSAQTSVIKLKLYQVTHPRRSRTPFGNVLLSQKLVPASRQGWIVFEVGQAVRTWLQTDSAANHGLALFAYYTNGERVPSEQLRFVQRGENRDLLQPALMVYAAEWGSDSRRRRTRGRARIPTRSEQIGFVVSVQKADRLHTPDDFLSPQ